MSVDSTKIDNQPLDPDDELLVAYLDGELDIRDRNSLEERLLNEESLRMRLHSLQSGWDMLDDLPNPDCDEKLVESTLELVVADVTRLIPAAKKKEQPLWQRHKKLALAACLALIAPLIGWFIVKQQRKRELNQQLADLEIAENIEAYIWGADMELMRELVWNESFNSMLQAANSFNAFRGEVSTIIRDTPLEQRITLVSELPVETRATIESRWNQFRGSSPESVLAIRETAESVNEQKDSDLLLQTMAGYASWRQWLPNDLRDPIETTSGKERSKAIQDAIDYSMSRMSRDSARTLSESTVEKIMFVLNHILRDRIESDPSVSEFVQRQGKSVGDRANRILMAWMLEMVPRPPELRSVGKPITRDELERIADVLDDSELDMLNLSALWQPYTGRNPELEARTLLWWAKESLRRTSSFQREDRTLIERYLEIDVVQRDELDLMEPSRFKKHLSNSSGGRFGRFGGGRGGPPSRKMMQGGGRGEPRPSPQNGPGDP